VGNVEGEEGVNGSGCVGWGGGGGLDCGLKGDLNKKGGEGGKTPLDPFKGKKNFALGGKETVVIIGEKKNGRSMTGIRGRAITRAKGSRKKNKH